MRRSTPLLPLLAGGLLTLACGACTSDSEAVSAAREPLRGLGDTCGGLATLSCEDALTCFYRLGICGAGDQTGTCQRRPEVCTFIYKPVCGCDGHTYPNRCAAEHDGVSIKYRGACGAKLEESINDEPAEAGSSSP